MSKKSNGAEKVRKIILFLSDRKEGAKEQTYICPEDETPDGKYIKEVRGTQTNEAPVKYLLTAYPDVREVLCIVTSVAEESGAFEVLEAAVKKQKPETGVIKIPFKDKEDFAAGPLAEIMSRMKKVDEILLDTTGGLRDAIMQLLLVSRALSFSGIPTVGAVYANYGAKQIVDCSHLIGLFDLVGGMQELASFGSVKTLRDYYGDTVEPAVKALLDAMEGLQEDITLCRTGKLERRIEVFNAAMEGAEGCEDPLIRVLLPAFQAKFGKKLSVPGLIRWCVNSDMLQQALTIYKERIPTYVLRDREDLVKVIDREKLTDATTKRLDKLLEQKKDYQTNEEAMFHLLGGMGRTLKWNPDYYSQEANDWIEDPVVLTLENLEALIDRSPYFQTVCPAEQLRDILMDYHYIRMLRNMINHANDQSTPNQKPLLNYLARFGYKRPDEVGAGDIRLALEQGLKNLNPRPKKERRK